MITPSLTFHFTEVAGGACGSVGEGKQCLGDDCVLGHPKESPSPTVIHLPSIQRVQGGMSHIVNTEMKYVDSAGVVITMVSVLSDSGLHVLVMTSEVHMTWLPYLFSSSPTVSRLPLTASDKLVSLLSSEHPITCSLWGFDQEWSSPRLSFTQMPLYSILSIKSGTGPLPICLIFILCYIFYAIFIITQQNVSPKSSELLVHCKHLSHQSISDMMWNK